MASSWWTISLLPILVVTAAASRTLVAPSPSLDQLCPLGLLTEMNACLAFMVTDSNQSAPGKSCCEGAKKVVDVSPMCLCQAQKTAKDLGNSLNATRATELPDLCKVEGPKGGCPASSPSTAPAPVPAPEPKKPSPAPKKPLPPAPAPVEDPCRPGVIMKMQACLDFVMQGSNDASPSSACCAGAEAVVKVSPMCLCEAMKTAESIGKVNSTRASELPGDCKIQGPPGGCEASGSAPPPPTPAPTPVTASPPTGSSETPALAPSVAAKSSATSAKISFVSVLVGVAAAISFL